MDDFPIEQLSGLKLKLHTPRSAGTVVNFDQPWEGNTSFFVTILKDGDRFRMSYRGSNSPEYVDTSVLEPGEETGDDHPHVTAYAESRDGIHWQKPSLGLYEFQGSKDNSIVWMDKPGEAAITGAMSVFKDGNPDALPSQRYKALGGLGYPLVGLVSLDGFRWTELQGQKSLIEGGFHRNAFDSLDVAFWDSYRQGYSLFFRDTDRGLNPRAKGPDPGSYPGDNYGNRSFKFATSQDFVHWSTPRWADFGEAPTEHLYTNGAQPYYRAPHIYLAFPKRFQPWRKLYSSTPFPGASDAILFSSRDGLHWDRQFMEAFIRPGRDEGNWTPRNNLVSVGVHPTASDEISLYILRNYTFPSCPDPRTPRP